AEAITVVGNGAEPAATRITPDDAERIYEKARREFAPTTKPEKTGIKGSEEKNEKKIPSATGEEYVIKEGDSFDSIAKAKYGNASFAGLIAEANPGVKATALRVGKHLVLPLKTEKKAEEPVVAAKTPERIEEPVIKKADPAPTPSLTVENGKKVYTIQTGDTLSGISVKVYNTSRHYQKIYEANKDVIDDPNMLSVGAKLVMPDLPAKAAAPNGANAGAVATTSPAPVPAGAKT